MSMIRKSCQMYLRCLHPLLHRWAPTISSPATLHACNQVLPNAPRPVHHCAIVINCRSGHDTTSLTTFNKVELTSMNKAQVSSQCCTQGPTLPGLCLSFHIRPPALLSSTAGHMVHFLLLLELSFLTFLPGQPCSPFHRNITVSDLLL